MVWDAVAQKWESEPDVVVARVVPLAVIAVVATFLLVQLLKKILTHQAAWIFWIFLGVVVLGVIVLGVRMMQLSRALRQDEVGVVSGRVGGSVKEVVTRARIALDREEMVEKEKARAEAGFYTRMKQIELEMRQLDLEKKKRELELEHRKAKDEVELSRTRNTKQIEHAYQGTDLQRMIVEQLPAILEARNKVIPNLRTYIAGPHEHGVVGLLAGLAEFGPDVMTMVNDILNSVGGGVGESEAVPAPGGQPQSEIPPSQGVHGEVRRNPDRVGQPAGQDPLEFD